MGHPALPHAQWCVSGYTLQQHFVGLTSELSASPGNALARWSEVGGLGVSSPASKPIHESYNAGLQAMFPFDWESLLSLAEHTPGKTVVNQAH